MTRWIVSAVSVLAVVYSVPHFTSGQSARSATKEAAPAETPTGDPQQSQSTNAASTPSATPTKKVWTNDDVGDLRGHSAISTVGAANAKPTKQAATKVASTATINSYRNQILKLQGQLPDMDSKIAELQGVLSGNTVNSTRHATGARIDDWHDELIRLVQQRADIASKISDLQDQARHGGVPENQIPE
jgi:hypothetical protein